MGVWLVHAGRLYCISVHMQQHCIDVCDSAVAVTEHEDLLTG
jgi:hypothetical protein